MAAPLADVRVLAIEQFGAGPWGTLQLADLGADVVKIEDPAHGGDISRYVPPYQAGEDSLYFEAFNRGKRSVALDLRTDGGRRAFERLVEQADAVLCNLRGGQPERLGVTYDQLKHVNPRIVCCSLTGFGMTGPRAAEPAYDYVLQAMAGWMSLTGAPDQPPTRAGLSLVDFSTGYVAALALMAGLWRARRDGVGCDCDISLFETGLSLLNYFVTWVATEGYEPRRQPASGHASIVPFQAFETADGWITVACAKHKFWVALCDALERPDLAGDPRFADFARRDANRAELAAILDPIVRAQPTDAVLARLAAHGVPSARVNSIAEALADPQVRARDAVVGSEHPRFGTVKHVASPFRLTGHAVDYRRAPLLGEHTDELLGDAGG